MLHIIYLLVKSAALKALIDELADWKKEGCVVIVAGQLEKRPQDAFIILNWDHPVPETFQRKLNMDTDILDHFGLNVHVSHAILVRPEAYLIQPEA